MSDTRSGGITFLPLLFIVLLVLKLTDMIDISWWWVTAPLWGGAALIGGFFILIPIIALIACAATAIFFKVESWWSSR